MNKSKFKKRIEEAYQFREMKIEKEKYTFNSWKFSSALRHKRIFQLKINVRKASNQIGISSATLSRLESGKTPDLITYYYCCLWLEVDTSLFFVIIKN